MKKYFTLFIFILCFSFSSRAQWVTIPDANFVTFLQIIYPSCMNGDQMDTTCNEIMNTTLMECMGSNISNLEGIEYFNSLTKLSCDYNQLVSLPNLPNSLRWLDCDANQLTSLPVLPDSLRYLDCMLNQLTDLPALPSFLDSFNCNNNLIVSLPVLPNSLEMLDCWANQLTSLPSLPGSLKFLFCSSNQLTSLPILPDSLRTLDCFMNQITSLPTLPNSIKVLSCGGNPYVSLPALPTSLTDLQCGGNQLISLPALPNSLINLHCSVSPNLALLPPLPNSLLNLNCDYNSITSLPSLPNSLKELFCRYNLLTSLPALPNSLLKLYCNNNQLTGLPVLPGGITDIQCHENQIVSLPFLPDSLTLLKCDNNLLTTLPACPASLQTILCSSNQLVDIVSLPPVIKWLNLSNNPMLTCLPSFQKFNEYYASYFSIAGTSITCLPNVIQHPLISSLPAIDTMPVCDYINANDCEVGWNVKGKVYNEVDNDCSTYEGINLQNVKVELHDDLNNIVESIYSYQAGFTFHTSLLNYKIQIDTSGLPFNFVCPNNFFYALNSNAIHDSINFGLQCVSDHDLGISSIERVGGIFFPGNDAVINISAGDIQNYYGMNCNITGLSGSVECIIDGPVTYNGVEPGSLVPNSVSGNTLVWNISDFSQLDFNNSFKIILHTDTSATAVQNVCVHVTVNSGADDNPANDTLTNCFVIVNSFDPNVKEVYPVQSLDNNQWLTYTIRFQNTGSASAENIKVVDTLDSNLDWLSFKLLSYSHPLIAQLSQSGIAKFSFVNINLPDSTSDEIHSHGYVQYKIKMKSNLAIGTHINNTASIYFDYNSPIKTNNAQFAFDYPEGIESLNRVGNIFSLFPNPANESITIKLSENADEIVVYDLSGREILVSNMKDKNEITLSLKSITAGFYYASVVRNNHKVGVKPLVKM